MKHPYLLLTIITSSSVIGLVNCNSNPRLDGPSGDGDGDGFAGSGSGDGDGDINVGDGDGDGDGDCTEDDPCVSVEPACGDGRINQPEEICDDGNTESGDGCTGNCAQIEANFACPTPGKPCVSTVSCGDGLITGDETCDDGNKQSKDGCTSACQLEPGWACPIAGFRCEAAECGDGIIAGFEECEWEPSEERPEGCGSDCKIDQGYDCDPMTFVCALTDCGNEVVERGEQCDDPNDMPFDGCYQCRREPDCSNGVCTSVCGDGQRYDDEDCDDGNTISGDGCSSNCKVEEGFHCTDILDDPPPNILQPVIFRDFVGVGRATSGNTSYEHIDFNGITGPASLGMVEDELDDAGKPVYACPGGDCTQNPGYLTLNGERRNLTSPENFEHWYRDFPQWNVVIPGSVLLERQPSGQYVFESAPNLFDPIGAGGWVALGMETRPCNPERNVSFTSETRFWFEYQGGERFDFSGDDDTWVFLNGRLAIDIGGLHTPLSGYFILDDDTDGDGPDTSDGTALTWTQLRGGDIPANRVTIDFGLDRGGIYEVAMFQAERNQCGSNFKVTLENFAKPLSECRSECGDGIVASDELCDDGTGGNDGGYGNCGPDCRSRGPFCGDAQEQMPPEACDDGVNLSQYGGCAPGCVAGPYCGDGIVQSGFEECDDGTNDGGYNECAQGCIFGPRCGDGKIQSPHEECDDGNRSGGDGCSANCKSEVVR